MLRNTVQEKTFNRIFIRNITVSCAFVFCFFFPNLQVPSRAAFCLPNKPRVLSHPLKYIQKHLNCVFFSIIIKVENLIVAFYYYMHKSTCLMHLCFFLCTHANNFPEVFTLIMPVLILQEPFHIFVAYIFILRYKYHVYWGNSHFFLADSVNNIMVIFPAKHTDSKNGILLLEFMNL